MSEPTIGPRTNTDLPGSDQLTYEEMTALLRSGQVDSTTLLRVIDGPEQRMALEILDNDDQAAKASKWVRFSPAGEAPIPFLGNAAKAAGGLAAGAAAAIPWKQMMGKSVELATELGGAALGSKMGHPILGMLLGRHVGKAGRGLAGRFGAVTNPVAEASARSTRPRSASSRPSGSPATPNVPTGRAAVPNTPSNRPDGGGLSSPATSTPPNLRATRSVEDIREQVGKGVRPQVPGTRSIADRPDGGNLSKLKVLEDGHGQRYSVGAGAHPKNLSTKRTAADVHEQVTGSSRNGYADPRGHDELEYPTAANATAEEIRIREQIGHNLDQEKRMLRRKPLSRRRGER
jgi:hypothetical protein